MSVGIAARSAPLYARIAQQIAEDIEAGRYTPGSLLPPEMALCKQFGVSRITLRAALKELQLNGMVSRRAGVGTRVEAGGSREHFVLESKSLEELIQFTEELTVKVIQVDVVNCDAVLAAELGCDIGEKFTRIQNLRSPKQGPAVCLSTHYVPNLDPGQAKAFNGRFGSLATMVEHAQGASIESIRQSMDAERLNARQAKLLDVVTGEAALSRWRWYRGPQQRLIMVSHTLFPRKRYSYSFTVWRRPGRPFDPSPIALAPTV